MTASVPLIAPATPPETGESICTMLFLASAAAISAATREPVVERSMKRLTRLPCDDAALAGRDLGDDLRRRQARHHGLDPVGDIGGDDGKLRAQRDQRRHRVVAGVVDDELVAGLDQPARHRLAHIAEPDKADVHVVSVPCRLRPK